MKDKTSEAEKIFRELESNEQFRKMPASVKKSIMAELKDAIKPQIPVPIITFKENGWFIALAPLFDLAAQGKTETEAIDDLKVMIDDYMADVDIKKPKMEAMTDIHVVVSSHPLNPLDCRLEESHGTRQNTPVEPK